MRTKLSVRTICLVLFSVFITVIILTYTNNSIQNFSDKHLSGISYSSVVKPDLFIGLPNITLFIRTTFSKQDLRQFAICDFFRTAALYWSRKLGPVRFLLDNNSSADHKYGKLLLKYQDKLQQNISVRFESIPNDYKVLHMSSMPIGYNIQLYSSFFIDLYVDTEIVAWTDTDTAFSTPVTKENIINNGKLVVKGIPSVYHKHEIGWDASVKIIIGHPFVTNFMTYFPMFIWKDTIKNCREYIIRRHNASIADVLRMATMKSRYSLSPSCVILTYAYYFERHRYEWHIDPENNLTAYNKKHITPGFELRVEDTIPEVHLTIHSKYCKNSRDFNYFLNTFCPLASHVNLSLPDRVASLCEKYKNQWPKALFIFQSEITHLKDWCRESDGEQCKKAVRKHFENVKRYVRNGEYDLNLNRTKIDESLTKVFDCQCDQLY